MIMQIKGVVKIKVFHYVLFMMRSPKTLERYRVTIGPRATEAGLTFGDYANVRLPSNQRCCIVVCDGMETGWDHVSVSLKHRCPTWEEMDWIKRLFWEPNDTVVQFHPPESKHVSVHPYCLHLWRCIREEFPMPPITAI